MNLEIIKTLVIWGLVYAVVSLLPLPEPFPRAIRIVVTVFVVLYLLRVFAGI